MENGEIRPCLRCGKVPEFFVNEDIDLNDGETIGTNLFCDCLSTHDNKVPGEYYEHNVADLIAQMKSAHVRRWNQFNDPGGESGVDDV